MSDRIQSYYDTVFLTYFLAVLTLLGLWRVRGIRRHLELAE
jgi:hypothetical protein